MNHVTISCEHPRARSRNPADSYHSVNPLNGVDLAWCLDLLRSSSMSNESVGGGGGARCFFPIFSLLSHSCRSNSKFLIYPSHKVAVLAQTAIAAGDEVTVSRVPVLEPTWKRRAMLFR